MIQEAVPEFEEALNEAQPQRSILVADDDESQVLALTTRLEKQGFKTLSAYSGNECIALARAELPNLIVVDICMPDIDGLRVCEKLADSDETWPVLPRRIT